MTELPATVDCISELTLVIETEVIGTAPSVNTTFAVLPDVPWATAISVSPSQEQTIQVVVKSPIESATTVHGMYCDESYVALSSAIMFTCSTCSVTVSYGAKPTPKKVATDPGG